MRKGLESAASWLADEPRREVLMEYVGIDRAYRRARWCARAPDGAVLGEDWAPADEDALARLVSQARAERYCCLEMMSGSAWGRDRLEADGWPVQIADARKAKAVASLAARQTSSTRACWPSSLVGTWSLRSGCRPLPTASSESVSAAACTWCGFEPPR